MLLQALKTVATREEEKLITTLLTVWTQRPQNLRPEGRRLLGL